MFVDGRNWSGSPDPVGDEVIGSWSVRWTGRELAELDPDIVVPLGPSATRGVERLASLGLVRPEAVLRDMPHPSGANAERIACFLGTKAPDLASSRTDGHALVAARERMSGRVAAIFPASAGDAQRDGVDRRRDATAVSGRP